MSVLSRWLRRIIDRSIEHSLAKSALAQISAERFRHELLQQPRYADPRRLARFEHQVYSQGGEDGIVREIFRRIGETDRVFVELGAGDGLENGTAFLLMQGWSGTWFEGSQKNVAAIRERCARWIAAGTLRLREDVVTAENAARLLLDGLRGPEFDFLSLDLDRNTYHVWAALGALKPRVVAIEYNAQFPADMAWTVDYDAARWWNGTIYYGASLKALETLGARLGYALVGCDIAGVNAFFVRADLVGDRFAAPFSA
ncbi:MAG TPA: hypothetical protein VKB52_10680, partial [Rhodanobacteraceae bacterium]|nr:hypothetical protein [Rhodanobacteraceae bacterium]